MRMSPRTPRRALAVLALAAIVGLPCVAARLLRAADEADTLRITIQQEPDSLHPLLMDMAAATEISGDNSRPGPLQATLCLRGDDWVLRPYIAAELPSLANGQWKILEEGGRMQTTWHLRPEAKWSDGTPITADDFIFAYQVIMDNRVVGVVTRDQERRIETMTAEGADRKTLVITWKEPFAYADTGHACLPRHIEEPVYSKDPASYHKTDIADRLVGCGPYVLKKWNRSESIVLERNPNYWGEMAKIQRIIYSFTSDTNTIVANILSGTLDAVSPTGMTFEAGLALKADPPPGFTTYFTPGLVWEHIDFNLENPWLADKRVRQALTYGIDREKMVKVFFEGQQPVADGWLPPKHYAHHPNLKKYAYDPAKANALLDEAGWKKGADGWRVNAAGERFKLIIRTTAQNSVREQIEQYIQSNWKKLGVELAIENQEAKVFFGETVKKRKFEHLAMFAWLFGPQADGETNWTMKNIPTEANGWTGQNYGGFKNAEIDRIDNQVPKTLAEAERVKLLHQEQELWLEELPAIPLYFRCDVSAAREGLKEWRPTGTDTGVTWNCQRWSLMR
ncbi:MAG: peptide ABC transporter substrate-binding protein [Planctomycetes bacterium]|nr:peptide ABC transporter substrate-binding protein [Planctomycetota bacterium]